LALRLEDGAYQAMRDDSLIGDEVLDDLKRELRARRRVADRAPGLDLAMDVHELVRSVPLFAPLATADLDEVAALLRPRLALSGERLIVKGTRGDAMFFVASGAVEVDVLPQPVRLGSGSFFGEVALLTRQPRNADVTALGYARLLVLEGRDFRRFLRAHPDLRAELMGAARERLGRPLDEPSARAG
jgi:CPA1 family monovalent cation:H+ antiporter